MDYDVCMLGVQYTPTFVVACKCNPPILNLYGVTDFAIVLFPDALVLWQSGSLAAGPRAFSKSSLKPVCAVCNGPGIFLYIRID